MKKISRRAFLKASALSAAALSLAACGSTSSSGSVVSGNSQTAAGAAQTADTITVTSLNANSEEVEVTVPRNPERVAVLDLATLDILDNLGLGDRVTGVPTITLDYLAAYAEGTDIIGTVKTPDLEAVMACDPQIIFMGGRGAEYYDALCEIAPVIRLISDADLGLVESVRKNASLVGSIFGVEEQVNDLLTQYDDRISALAAFAEGKTAVLGMCTSGSFGLLGNDGRCALIVNEVGFDNIGADAAAVGDSGNSGRSGGRGNRNSADSTADSSASGEESSGRGGSTPTHGNEVSFELIVDLDPDYIFVMDRDSAIGTEGAQLAREIMENELIMKTSAYQNGNLVILEHPGIWYLAEGGITSLGIMLDDLESALL